MKEKALEKQHIKIIALNKKARYEYFIDREVEAGLALLGAEIKSIRQGKVNIKDAYARIKAGEVWVHQLHIGVYPFAHHIDIDPLRVRKLLLHKAEIKKLYGSINEKGKTLVPLKLYLANGKAKLTIGVARGKHKYDKRESIKKRDTQRDMDRDGKG